MAMEELELTAAQAQALLDSPTPLADVYRYFEKLETGYMDVVRDSIENRADDACKAQAELRKAAIYPHSAAYAKEHGELEQYRASNNANLQCKEAIEAAVREHFDGMYLSHDAAKGVIETYGMDRVMLVLANTVQLQDWDGRYSPRNKEWAKTIPNYNSDTVRCGYALNSHPAVLNGFIDLVREEHLRRQPLTVEDIQAEAERILRELRAPDMPNSPHGTHYMARISPEFLNRAGSKDHDRLMNLLPFRSLSFTGMKGLPGTYATILANEDRSKELRQPRPSVREHLKQEPKQEVQVNFRVSPEELALIEQKMSQLGTKNREAYLRKMALDGYVVQLDLPELKELVSLLRRSSNNLNQLTRRVHETGRVYDADLEDIAQRQEQLWEGVKKILTQLSNLS